jgi:hypothetical protein
MLGIFLSKMLKFETNTCKCIISGLSEGKLGYFAVGVVNMACTKVSLDFNATYVQHRRPKVLSIHNLELRSTERCLKGERLAEPISVRAGSAPPSETSCNTRSLLGVTSRLWTWHSPNMTLSETKHSIDTVKYNSPMLNIDSYQLPCYVPSFVFSSLWLN